MAGLIVVVVAEPLDVVDDDEAEDATDALCHFCHVYKGLHALLSRAGDDIVYVVLDTHSPEVGFLPYYC